MNMRRATIGLTISAPSASRVRDRQGPAARVGRRVALALTSASVLTMVSTSFSAADTPCQSSSIAIDVAQSDTSLIAFSGKSWGQVLLTPQTQVAAVTVWLPPIQGSISAAMHLFIAQTDTV